jgi:hypothetical protein
VAADVAAYLTGDRLAAWVDGNDFPGLIGDTPTHSAGPRPRAEEGFPSSCAHHLTIPLC